MCARVARVVCLVAVVGLVSAGVASAESGEIAGVVRDETGGALPGVAVELRGNSQPPAETTTDWQGEYRFEHVEPGQWQVLFVLINFATVRRDATVPAAGRIRIDPVLHLALNADVSVSAKSLFTNLADAANPAENLVGVAQSASQGAITARQLDARPVMRSGEVLETVPGVVISQHSGEGKANQYYLRGFNLDHGTDFATTVAGMPVNLPTHGHGQGYSDLNFVIPELVSGMQFSKGPYFAEQGDFAAAGAAAINYVSGLAKPTVRVVAGDEGYRRVVAAASTAAGAGRLLGAIEVEHNDGPWDRADDYRKLNGVARFSRGDSLNGFTLTAMAYRGRWNATDQIPDRAIHSGLIDRFGTIDPTDGGDTSRYSGSFDWQHSGENTSTRVTAYAIASDLNLYSNFTYFLEDPVHGDQIQQVDDRIVSGGRVSQRRITRWRGRSMQNTIGAQLRNDDITNVGLFHTEARRVLDTIRQDAVLQTSAGAYAQNETEWTPWLRTLAGIRTDVYRFHVDARDPANGGNAHAAVASPKGGAVFGPWEATELYVNAGLGYHSNDARGVTIRRDPITGAPVEPVTPLVRATGAEVGVRSVRLRHLQSSLAIWMLNLDSELVFAGDVGTTEASRPSHRQGVEWANYFAPRPWLVFDADVSASKARFTDVNPLGDRIPGAVETVVSAGATVHEIGNVFGSVRLRYFGPRPLLEDNSARSRPTTLANGQAGYKLTRSVQLAVDVFNILDARANDIDYYYVSRLRGEPPAGIADLHSHPTAPRTVRAALVVNF